MGLYITIYGIKLDEVNNIINSKNDTVYEKIINIAKNEYNVIEPFDSGETIEKVIYDIVFGNFGDIKQNIAYYFGALVLCSAYKIKLPNYLELKYDFQTNEINKILSEDFNIDFDINSLIGANPGILKMPDIFTGFDEELYECPEIGLLTMENLRWLKDKLKTLSIKNSDIKRMIESDNNDTKSKGYDYQNIKWLKENVDYCVKNNFELLIICG